MNIAFHRTHPSPALTRGCCSIWRVVVTGATQGLGVAIAQALASHGARVLVSDRDPARCARTAGALRNTGHEAVALAADLMQVEAIDGSCDAAGSVDVLVCNAGI